MENLLAGIKQGKEREIAKAISLVENNRNMATGLLKKLYIETSPAYLVGITGPPGSGKSTLTEKIVQGWREDNLKVGVIAIDPSSQYSGGALLGDRIRMQEIVTDKGVFIRSMATRGSLGGLNPAIFDTIIILSAAGYQYIIIETVGVGQNEIDIVNLADTTIIVTIPEAGDEIQAYKAGLMETGDIFVVNKADRPEVERMELIIKQMLDINYYSTNGWIPPVIKTIATKKQGTKELIKVIYEHKRYMKKNNLNREKRFKVIKRQIVNIMEDKLKERYILPVINDKEFFKKVTKIFELKADPYTVVEELLEEGGVGLNED